MWQNILVAYDGSEYANKALSNACAIAKAMQAKLHVLSVIKLPEPLLGLQPEAFINDATKFYKQHFLEAVAKCPECVQTLSLDVEVGRPIDGILNYATQKKIDLIMIGYAKKKSLLDRLILGSVAKQVLDHAACSVFLVR